MVFTASTLSGDPVTSILCSLENKHAEEGEVQAPRMYGTKMGLTAS